MDTTQPHQNAGGSGVATAAASGHQHQRTASISALPIRQSNNADLSSPQSPDQNQIQKQTNFPQHFIVRPGVTKHTASGTVTTPGPIVPLIAVDQLPEWLDLFGVPRELSLEQTVGLTNLGTVVRDPEFYDVYMHTDLNIAPANGSNNENYRREDRSNALLISSDVDTSGPPSSSSSAVSLPTSPLIPRLDPAAKGLAASRHAYINDTDKKAGVSNNGGNNGSSTKKHPNTSSQQATMSQGQGQYQRLPSPTAAGSTPPTHTSPYPLIHPTFPHPTLHPQAYPPPHPHAAYPTPPPPAPSSVHPADRMLYSWTPPSQHKSKSTSASASRQKTPNANPPSTTSNSNNGTNSAGGNTNTSSNSIYCKHWCHRGTCRWGAQCRYAHAMPATAEGLREVGLSHHPAWWTTAYNMMAYGTPAAGGFGAGAWYPPPPPHHPHPPVPPQHPVSGKYYGGGGGGRKAQKEKEKEKEKERKEAAAVAVAAEKGKEKEKEKEKGKMVEGRGQGQGQGEGDGNRGAPESGKRVDMNQNQNQNQPKKDNLEGKVGTVGQEQRKLEQPEQPEEVPKLVEI
ncbi:hypothetical protein F5B19DRAFT_116923 [Rostrohypoxylon terebratum]|nr:hypothetical protein F5B19DRAFT_116923 [Rostrohypoxylon terebratum]